MLATQVCTQIKSILRFGRDMVELSECSQIANLYAQKGQYANFLFIAP